MQQQSLRCPFYDRVGACRHGSQCSRQHIKPVRSRTLVFWKLFENPQTPAEDDEFAQFHQRQPQGTQPQPKQIQYTTVSPEQLRQAVDTFFLDLVSHLSKYGPIREFAICCNRNAHLSGNVLVRFDTPVQAQKCLDDVNDEWFNGSPVFCDLSPVREVQDAICGEYLRSKSCSRGPHCNFIHTRLPSRETSLKVLEASLNG